MCLPGLHLCLTSLTHPLTLANGGLAGRSFHRSALVTSGSVSNPTSLSILNLCFVKPAFLPKEFLLLSGVLVIISISGKSTVTY